MKVIFLEEGSDLDALSSAYGALLLFDDAYLFKPNHLSKKASEVFKIFKNKFRVIEELPDKFDIILTDHHNLEDYKKLYNERIKEVYVYDHHPKPIEGFKGIIDKVGSATTLVVEELIKHNKDIDSESATLLALGIYEDTGFLTYEGTTPRDLEALKWLLEKGASLRLIRQILHETFSKEGIEFLAKHLLSIETIFIDEKIVSIVVIRAEEYEPSVLQIVYELKEVKNSDAFFVIVNAGLKTYLFGRSLKGVFDVSKVLEILGGGGHEFASAIKLEGVSVERLRSVLVALLKGEKVKLYVKQIMTSPPFVLHKDISVENAINELSQRNFAGCPVIDDQGRVVGIVYKKNLLKVPKKFSAEPIEKFMITEFHILEENDLIWKAEEILSKFGEKLIPVVNSQEIPIGVVTRMDIIQTIRGQHAQLLKHERKVKIPSGILPIAKEVGQIAKELGYKAYIIGGVVRDILLGRNIYDLDFVVEGDAIEVAKKLSQKHNVSLHPFKEFSTAHLKIGNMKIEFATTRRETYSHPGAYPSVEYASLKEDVIRRDFTINAMAISVNEEDFGMLIDYFGGYRDLKDRLIRVLHPLSFVEDPVRILRALRFAGKLGFKLSRGTEKLLKQAIPFIQNAPKGRILNELKLAFMEEKVLEILELYRKYHVLEEIIPDFLWSDDTQERLIRLKQLINWHKIAFPKEVIDYGWLYLIVILLKSEHGDRILSDMSAPAWSKDAYRMIKDNLHKVKSELKKTQKNSEIYQILKGKPLAVLLILMTYDEIIDKVKLYMEKLRYVKVDVEKFKHLKGKELGVAIEEEKKRIMDTLI